MYRKLDTNPSLVLFFFIALGLWEICNFSNNSLFSNNESTCLVKTAKSNLSCTLEVKSSKALKKFILLFKISSLSIGWFSLLAAFINARQFSISAICLL